MTVINHQMKSALSEFSVKARLKGAKLSHELELVAQSDIIQREGCFFIESLAPLDVAQAVVDYDYDRTALEIAENLVYIQDSLPQHLRGDAPEVLVQGILYACELLGRLRKIGRFEVLLTFESPQILPERKYTSCTVRFYGIRDDGTSSPRLNPHDYDAPVMSLDTLDEGISPEDRFCEQYDREA